MWDPGWDGLFRDNEWGKYPCEELVRFTGRRFYKAPDRAAVSMLEIGCGPGANLWYLAREGFSVHGLDGSAVALDRAARRMAQDGLTVGLHQGDAIALPFPDASFDAVLDVECIYANSLADSRRILAEVRRVLKPGGWLFSKTFATGMGGEAGGETLPGEPNSYVKMGPDSPLHSDYGLIRLTAEEEIPQLYAGFSALEWDYLERSVGNRRKIIREWVIAAQL